MKRNRIPLMVNVTMGTLLTLLSALLINILTGIDSPLIHLPLPLIVSLLAIVTLITIVFNTFVSGATFSPTQKTAKLIVSADKEFIGEAVYLLSSQIWHGKLAPERNPSTQKQYIEQRHTKNKTAYITDFSNLTSGVQYMLWTDSHPAVPITLSRGGTTEIQLPPQPPRTLWMLPQSKV